MIDVKQLVVLVFCIVLAAPLRAQSVEWQVRDAEVWAREQVVRGTMDGADAGVLHHDETPIAFEVTDGAFAIPVVLEEGVNRFVACTEDEAVCSDTLRWTLGYRLRSEVFAYAEADGRTVTLHGEVLENPEDDALSFSWQQDPDNPQPVSLAGTAGLQTSVTLPEDAPAGEYYFDLLATTADGEEVRARTFVTVGPEGIRPFDIETDHAAWIDRAVIYEIAPWYFARYWPGQRFRMITDKIPEMASLGVTAIWLQPITATHGGGQAYDVTDYFAVWDDLGTEEDLHDLVETAHAHGLKVLFDFVPNHSSIHHPYAQDAITYGEASHYYDFYKREPDDAPYSNNYTEIREGRMTFISYFWPELVTFNYDNPEAERYIIEASRYWIETYDIDGYRFDAVWGPHARDPAFTQAWRLALKRVKPEILMLAEAKAPRSEAFPEGFPSVFESFDVAYDWKDLAWCISHWAWANECGYFAYEGGDKRSLFNSGLAHQRADDLREALTNNGDGFPPGAKILRYLENNDVPRFRAHHSLRITKMAAALLFSLHGVPMLYYGQEVGLSSQWPAISPLQSIQAYDEEGLWPYYQYLIQLRKTFPSLYSDTFEEVPVGPESAAGQTFAYHRWAGEEHLVGVVNLGARSVTAELALPVDALAVDAGETVYLTDLLTGDYVETAGAGLASVAVEVPGYATRLYVVADSILQVSVPTSVERPREVPAQVVLEPNYPNPFNPTTTIPFVLPAPGHVRVQVVDVLGRRVATLVDEGRPAGRHAVVFDGEGLPSGVYLIHLEAGGQTATQRMLMLK